MNLLDRLLGHDVWTTRQLLLRCADLSDEQLDQEFDIGHRTVRATFLHIVHNMEVWTDLMAGRVVSVDQNRRRADRSVSELLSRLERAAVGLATIAQEVAARDGWDERWVDRLDGRVKTYGGSIAHVITHSMHHRAQLLYLLRRLGLKDLPEGDVLSWEQRPESLTAD
jgi:uncharacterized damage-inducible protein DinB